MWVGLVVGACAGWWSLSNEVEAPIVTVAVSNDGALFSPWASEDVANDAWDGREGQLAPDCEWWNGTYYYDPSLCSHMSVTRMPAAVAEKALERATRCAAHADTDCVLSGEIGFSMPAAFVYDESAGMRMIVAPKLLEIEGGELKTVRLQDPAAEHPNQLFKFRDLVRAEYLKPATRTMATLELRGNDAYCVQALRRSVVPTCWAALD